jgi:dCTP diphosphatase
MSDDQTTVAELRGAVARFIAGRRWERFHTPKHLAMGIAIEAAEIMEHFQWQTVEEATAYMREPAKRAEVADELADVMIYCLSLANHAGIDVAGAIEAKLARNEGRFPRVE